MVYSLSTMLNLSTATLEDAEYFANSFYLKLMISARIICSSIAVILLTVLHFNRHRFLAHPSLKILLKCHFLWVYLTCIYTTLDHCYTAYLLAIVRDPTDLLVTEGNCMLRKVLLISAMYGTVVSMFAVSFERCKASAHFRTYEQSSKAYGCKLALLHLIVVGLYSAGYYLTYGGYSGKLVVVCTITTPRGEIFLQIAGSSILLMELWTTAKFVKLLQANKKESREIYTLSERYQLSENIRLLRIILPVVWSHVATSCVCLSIYLIGMAFGLTAARSFPLFEDTINLTFLQGFFIPYFFLKQFLKEARHNRGVIATNRATGEALNAVHSAVIQTGW